MPARVVRDVVHDYINLQPDDLDFIDNQIFQRLKFVRQTNAWNVFPSANHTRFEHSLGTMHLAVRCFETLLRTSRAHFRDEAQVERWRTTLRYAALLHDVGHTPLSHVCEGFLPVQSKMAPQLVGLLSNLGHEFTPSHTEGSPHEFSSCIAALQVFGAELLNLDVDVELFCRMILGQKFQESRTENVLISLVNSSTDMDKLDYIIRDGFMTRTANVDAERIVNSAMIDNNNRLAFGPTSLSVIWSLVSARNSLYMWVYTHHAVTFADFLVREAVRRLIQAHAEVGELFDPVRMIEVGLCDTDVLALLRKPEYAKDIAPLLPGLFRRDYYKVPWKSYYAYKSQIEDTDNRELIMTMVDSPDMVANLRSRLKLANDELFVQISSLKPFASSDAKKLRIITNSDTRESQTYGDLFNLSIYKSDDPSGKPPFEVPWVFLKADNSAGVEVAQVLSVLNDPNLGGILNGTAN